MRALIIPEDPALDQHVLKPVVQRIFADLGCPARVDVLADPHLRGASDALDRDVIGDIVLDNRMIDLFLLLVDRDCDRWSHEAKAAARQAEHPDRLIATLAHQEVEVWALALFHKELGAPWKAVRQHCDPKEAFFDPLIRRMAWEEAVGRGRKSAMRELGTSWSGLQQRCPEVAELKRRIAAWRMART